MDQVKHTTSLPRNPTPLVKRGTVLYGDELSSLQLEEWYKQESEAFFLQNSLSSSEDPWYAYMRYVNRIYAFSYLSSLLPTSPSILALGPGDGAELEDLSFYFNQPSLYALESSSSFRVSLSHKFPSISLVSPHYSGSIDLPDSHVDFTLALSVLHHIPNVSFVLSEIDRVLKPGGFVIVREPCSSMGIWGTKRVCTPNERGISKNYFLSKARRLGWTLLKPPLPIHFEPMNKLFHSLNLYQKPSLLQHQFLFAIDTLVNKIIAFNDIYWRDTLLSKFGPSSYFYLLRKG